MVSRELLKSNFNELEVSPSDTILDKCMELCLEYNIEEEEFVEHWMAYSVTNLNAKIVSPTLQQLNDMCKKIKKDVSNIAKKSEAKSETFVQIYNQSTANDDDDVVDDVMDTYCMTPKAKRSNTSRINKTIENTNKTIFSPVSYSPISTSQQKGTDIDNVIIGRGVIYTFGNSNLIKNTVWASDTHQEININMSRINTLSGDTEKENTKNNNGCLTSEKKYMVDPMNNRAMFCGDKIYKIGSDISNKIIQQLNKNSTSNEDGKMEKLELTHIDLPSSEEVYCLGRIFAGKNSLNKNTIKLVDMDEWTLRRTRLDCSKLRNYSFFPGQNVIVKGTNPRSTLFYVEEVFSECTLETTPAPVDLKKSLNMLITSAPYTDKDDLLYEKLSELMKNCKENRPDVLIITGPLLDSKCTLLTEIAEDFDEYFEKMIARIMDSVGTETHVVIVASHQDTNSYFVYPTHAYEIQASYNNLHLVPDPCIIDINGVHIGLTSTDVIGHLADQEYAVNAGSDKVKRALNYMFHQKSFYPLNPPPEDLPVDYDLLNQYGQINVLPNIMIVPSDLKCFIRDINNCLCINPGRLSDSNESGTFARLVINPPASRDTNLFNYSACQIVKT